MNLSHYFENTIRLRTFFENLKGLMFKKTIDSNNCYVLETNGIHTFFMRFAIDVIYLNKNKVVIKKIKKIKPYRLASIDFKCKYVLEFSNNEFIEMVKIGDLIKF